MIVELTTETLRDGALLALGERFYHESGLPGRFDRQVWSDTWVTILKMGFGGLWASLKEGVPVGAIGGVIHPDPNDGDLVAQEMFWFMSPEFRNGLDSFKLYTAFEHWARMRGAKRLVMACVCNQHIKSLRRFYESRGFRPVDISYFKNL